MSTYLHVSGLSYFCTDEKLRQAFIPFGTVVLAQVLRDESGHSIGLGTVHMARSEDVKRVLSEHQRVRVSGLPVDLWELADPEGSQGGRRVADDLRDTRAAQTGQDREQEISLKALHPVAAFLRRLIQALVPSSRTSPSLSISRGNILERH